MASSKKEPIARMVASKDPFYREKAAQRPYDLTA